MVTHEIDGVMVFEPAAHVREGGESDAMEAALRTLAERGTLVVVDVSGVRQLTARFLGILAESHALAARNGGAIALAGTTRVHRWLLRKTGLAGALTTHVDVAAAVDHLTAAHRVVA